MKINHWIKQIILSFILLSAGTAAFTGCSSPETSQAADTSSLAKTALTAEPENDVRLITCGETTVDFSGKGIALDGTSITITEAGTYEFTGTLNNGRIIVNAGKDASVVLVLNNFLINSPDQAPIYGENGQMITVTLKDGTDNQIKAGSGLGRPVSDGTDAAVYTSCDLLVNGSGSLSIQSEGGEQYGIRSKSNLTISSGNISIVSGSGGIKAQTLLTVEGGTFVMNTAGDAFHSKQDMVIEDGTFSVSTEDDAFHADGHLTVNGGDIQIFTCYEGMEAGTVTINGGMIDLISLDDGINAANDATSDLFIRITGGNIHVSAEGDGLDSNGDFYMEGGILYVDGPSGRGNGALDYDGKATITGGTIVAVGSAGMIQSFSDQSTQPVILMYYEQAQTAGTTITLAEADNTLLSYSPSKEFSAAVISTERLTDESTYLLTTDETEKEFTISGITNQIGAETAGNNIRQNGHPSQNREVPDGEKTGRPGEGKNPGLMPRESFGD